MISADLPLSSFTKYSDSPDISLQHIVSSQCIGCSFNNQLLMVSLLFK